MSFILDALRKSESRRKRSQIPDLDSPEPAPPPRPRRRRLLWPLAGVAVLALSVAGALWLLPSGWMPGAAPSPANEPVAAGPDERDPGRQPQMTAGTDSGDRDLASSGPDESGSGSGTGTDTATQAEAGHNASTIRPRQQRESPPIDAEAATRELERRMAEAQRRAEEARRKAAAEQQVRAARGDQAASAESPPEPRSQATERTTNDAAAGRADARADSERRRERSRMAEAAAERAANARAQTGAGEQPTPAPVRQSGPDAGDSPAQLPDYVRAWELPLSVRRKLPDLALTMHVFSPRPEERFVLINGERHTAGDVIGGSVELVEIRREGAIMDFDSHRFLLEPR